LTQHPTKVGQLTPEDGTYIENYRLQGKIQKLLRIYKEIWLVELQIIHFKLMPDLVPDQKESEIKFYLINYIANSFFFFNE
jgi:hypothetical protein